MAMNPTNYSLFGHIRRLSTLVAPGRLEGTPRCDRHFFVYNPIMFSRPISLFLCVHLAIPSLPLPGQQAPPASAAHTLLLPRRIVAGETVTLAVLDASGRLTPGVIVNFSNGDRIVTNATGRALFVAPSNPGVIYGTMSSHSARVYTTILTPAEVAPSSAQVSSSPIFASLADRFELSGATFCGQADANAVRVAGKPALVLASSPVVLIALPPSDLQAGAREIDVSCAKHPGSRFSITFLDLSLDADSSPLAPGEHRTLTVNVRGTRAKVPLEARNLSPNVAELVGGNPARVSSGGGTENAAHFELIGRAHGNFSVSVRLLPVTPQHQ
jgi:hypothetical protein